MLGALEDLATRLPREEEEGGPKSAALVALVEVVVASLTSLRRRVLERQS